MRTPDAILLLCFPLLLTTSRRLLDLLSTSYSLDSSYTLQYPLGIFSSPHTLQHPHTSVAITSTKITLEARCSLTSGSKSG